MTHSESDPTATQALDKLLMVMLDRLVHAYGSEYMAGVFDPLMPVDRTLTVRLLEEVLEREHGSASHGPGSGRSPTD